MIRRIMRRTLDGNMICSIDGTSLMLEPPRAIDPTSTPSERGSYYSHKNKEESHHSVVLILCKNRHLLVLASTIVTEDGGSQS